MTFKIRFRAFGGDSYDINAWYIDNIKIMEEESSSILTSCILGYYFYLNNAITGFVTDTTYTVPGNLVQYGTSYNACVEAIYASGNSSKTCTDFTSHFLIPPTGLTGTGIEDAAYLSWIQPVAYKGYSGRSAPPSGLMGYYIYRNGVLRDSVLNPDSLSYYDFRLDPGTYTYGVSAKYDLTTYGFAGQTDQSIQDGPVTVVIDYGRLLPFFEPWDQGSFNYNDWSFLPDQGNWLMNTNEGNPLPSAEFSWEPTQNDYVFNLQSPVLTALNVQCAKVWFDFDYYLKDNNFTGQEQLSAEIYYNSRWHTIMTYTNLGDVPWTAQHFDISIVRGRPSGSGLRRKASILLILISGESIIFISMRSVTLLLTWQEMLWVLMFSLPGARLIAVETVSCSMRDLKNSSFRLPTGRKPSQIPTLPGAILMQLHILAFIPVIFPLVSSGITITRMNG